jgi:hypothetical protein
MCKPNSNLYSSYKTVLLVVVCAASFAAHSVYAQDNYAPQTYGQPGYGDQNPSQADPPSRVARVSVIAGNVSLEPASINQFNVAEPNYPMTTGDRIYADIGANAEIQTGQLAVRLGPGTDLTVTAMTDTLAQFGIATGGVHLRSYNIYQGETVEIDTPNVAVTVLQAGDVRVDVNPANDSTTVFVVSGEVQVNGNGFQQVMEPGERLRLSGSNPVYAQEITAAGRGFGGPQDGLDRFSSDRDRLYESAYASEGQYVNPGTVGAEDLSVYGTWQGDPDYGGVWFPSNVSYDWQPYRNGHWTWVAPWGWTWIEAEPWGFAPFHYGRWNRFGNRWGWIPGPTVVRPIYSPALVVFVGGNNFGGGVTAWFPLGPREVYQPWYHTSPQYINRVNVSNIYDRNVVNVRNVYNSRTVVNTYVNVDNRNYANRQVATVAMQQDNFARGGRADQSQVRLNAQQLAAAPVLPHPLVTPERSMVAPSAAKVLPAAQARPTLASHEDNRFSGGSDTQNRMRNGGTFQQPGNQPNIEQSDKFNNQNQQRGQPNGQPQNTQPAQVTRQQPTQTQQPTVPQRVQPQQPAQTVQQTVQQQPAQPQNPPRHGDQGQQTQAPGRVTAPVQQAPVQQAAPQQQRPLVNRAVPPDPRPSFEQQRQAIQATDPGRPLGPQQLQNLRQNQPAGAPQQREQPHPEGSVAPAPRGGPVKPADPNKK